LLRVCSASDDEPTVRVDSDSGADDSGGRGLLLIEELTTAWGFEREGEQLCVWAQIPVT
jgi:hypothetical protein